MKSKERERAKTVKLVQDVLEKLAFVRRMSVDFEEFTYEEFDEMIAEIGNEKFDTVSKWDESRVVEYAGKELISGLVDNARKDLK